WHRGPTHGLLGIVGLGFAVAVVVRLVTRFRQRDDESPSAPLPMLVAVSCIAVLCHVLMDLPTSYGTRLLSPFDWRWFAFDWLPIIDIYLIAALAAGLIFGRASSASRRRLAVIVLAAVAANYGMRAVAHRQALTLAPQLFGRPLPLPCDADAVRTFADPTGATTVRRTDVPFVGGPLSVEATRPANLFNVVVRLDADGRVLDERIGR